MCNKVSINKYITYGSALHYYKLNNNSPQNSNLTLLKRNPKQDRSTSNRYPSAPQKTVTRTRHLRIQTSQSRGREARKRSPLRVKALRRRRGRRRRRRKRKQVWFLLSSFLGCFQISGLYTRISFWKRL